MLIMNKWLAIWLRRMAKYRSQNMVHIFQFRPAILWVSHCYEEGFKEGRQLLATTLSSFGHVCCSCSWRSQHTERNICDNCVVFIFFVELVFEWDCVWNGYWGTPTVGCFNYTDWLTWEPVCRRATTVKTTIAYITDASTAHTYDVTCLDTYTRIVKIYNTTYMRYFSMPGRTLIMLKNQFLGATSDGKTYLQTVGQCAKKLVSSLFFHRCSTLFHSHFSRSPVG